MENPKDEELLCITSPITLEEEEFTVEKTAKPIIFNKIEERAENGKLIAEKIKEMKEFEKEKGIELKNNSFKDSYEELRDSDVEKHKKLLEEVYSLRKRDRLLLYAIPSMILTPVGKIPSAYKNKMEYISDFIESEEVFNKILDFFYKHCDFTTPYRSEGVTVKTRKLNN